MDKKFRLPKDEFIDGQDVEGHGGPSHSLDGDTPEAPEGLIAPTDEDVEGHRRPVLMADGSEAEGLVDDEDVEAHRRPADDFTILPAPPSIGLRRAPGHGGELTGDDTTGE